jgi:acyl-CoA hydrolase
LRAATSLNLKHSEVVWAATLPSLAVDDAGPIEDLHGGEILACIVDAIAVTAATLEVPVAGSSGVGD